MEGEERMPGISTKAVVSKLYQQRSTKLVQYPVHHSSSDVGQDFINSAIVKYCDEQNKLKISQSPTLSLCCKNFVSLSLFSSQCNSFCVLSKLSCNNVSMYYDMILLC